MVCGLSAKRQIRNKRVIRIANKIIYEDICRILEGELPWERFTNASVLITGATGMLPSYLALTLLGYRKNNPACGLEIFVLARNSGAAKRRFASYWEQPYFHFVQADVCEGLPDTCTFDYIIHGASPADPRQFGKNPAGVFLPNVLGLYHILEAARKSSAKGVLFMSSGEIYGRLPATIETIHEDDSGVVDPMALRSCYAEGKRAGETLCKIWAEQFHVPAKVVRISHTFGPTMDIYKDSRSFAEFTRCVIERRDIQLKSDGSAVRPFCYVSDCAEGILRILLLGKNGMAYNLAGEEYCSILELADLLCGLFPKRQLHVVRTVRDIGDTYLEAETHPVIRVDTSRLKTLGWQPKVSIEEGFRRTIQAIEDEINSHGDGGKLHG